MQRMHSMPQLAGMPVVMLSGGDPEKYREAAVAAGAAGFLTKPVEVGHILEALSRALDLG